MTRQCARCSTALPEPARYCPRCGREAEPLPRSTSSSTGGSVRLWFMLAMFILPLVLVLIGTFMSHAPMVGHSIHAQHAKHASGVHTRELTQDPLLLVDGIPVTELKLNGVMIGHRSGHIPAHQILRRTPRVISMKDHNWYSISNGQVIQMHIEDPALLALLPLHGKQDIQRFFGSPQGASSTWDSTGGRTVYVFSNKGLWLVMNNDTGRLERITLTRPGNTPHQWGTHSR